MKIDKNQVGKQNKSVYKMLSVLFNHCFFNKLNTCTVILRCFVLISFDTNANNGLYLFNIMFSF